MKNLLTIVAVFFMLSCSGGNSEKDKEFNAYYMSKTFCKDYLKSPSSAEFAPSRDCIIENKGGGSYRVKGFVEAQNSFGAMIKSTYEAELTNTGGDNWRLNSLIIDGTKMK